MSIPKLSFGTHGTPSERSGGSPQSPRRALALLVGVIVGERRQHPPISAEHQVSIQVPIVRMDSERRLSIISSSEEGPSPKEFYRSWIQDGNSREEFFRRLDLPKGEKAISQLVNWFEVKVEDATLLLKREIASHQGEPVALLRGESLAVALYVYFASRLLSDLIEGFMNSLGEGVDVTETLHSILKSGDHLPVDFRVMMRELYLSACERSKEHGDHLIFNLLFLRIFLPKLTEHFHRADEAKEIVHNRQAFQDIIELVTAV